MRPAAPPLTWYRDGNVVEGTANPHTRPQPRLPPFEKSRKVGQLVSFRLSDRERQRSASPLLSLQGRDYFFDYALLPFRG
jgi:hypothetical protein